MMSDSKRRESDDLDEQLDESFPASDPPSLTDPSRKIVPNKDPVGADKEDPSTKRGQKGPGS